MNKDLIFEEMSISSAVQGETNKIMGIIEQQLNSCSEEFLFMPFLNKDVLTKHTMIKLPKPIFQYVDYIFVTVYFGQTKEDREYLFSEANCGGTFEIEHRTIIAKCLGFENGKIDSTFLKSVICHELKHAYQEMLYNNKILPSIFKTATNIINNPGYFENTIIYDVSRLLYYFNRNEINSKLEEYYVYLNNDKPQSFEELKKCPIIQEYQHHKGMFNDVFNYAKKPSELDNLNKIFKNIFGKSFIELRNIIKLGMDYSNIKMKKVFGRYKMEEKRKMNEMRYGPKRFYVR